MKTREERAVAYVANKVDGATPDEGFSNADLCDEACIAFIAGAESEHAELARWNNPDLKDTPNGNVLVKYIVVGNPATPYYTIGMRHLSGEWDCENELATHNPQFEIIGWREIHQ